MGHKKRVTFSASVCELAADRIASNLPHDLVEGIRIGDPKPFFAELIVGAEGISHGVAIMDGMRKSINKIWSRSTVQMLADKMAGAIVFVGHDDRNDTARPNVGQTVKGFHDAKGGKVEARAISYIKDQETKERIKSGELDVCSIEADLVLATDGDSTSWIVQAVEKVTGLILADSSKESPGFAGASVVAAVQMLAGDTDNKGDQMPTTKADVEKFIRDAGLNPADLFGGEALAKDQTVLGFIKAAMDEKSSDKEKEDLKKSNTEKDELIKKLEGDNLKSKIKDDAGPKIDEVLKGRQLSEAMAATLKKRTLEKLSTDDSLDVAKLDEAIKSEIEEGITFLKESGALVEDKKEGDKTEKSGDKTAPAPTGSDPGEKKKNELIPDRDF